MRHSEQLPLTAPWIGHVHAAELAAMSALLDAEHDLPALVQQDLLARCIKHPRTGRPGLSGDQVLRLAIARQLNGWTYAELAFHVADSASYASRILRPSSDPAASPLLDSLRGESHRFRTATSLATSTIGGSRLGCGKGLVATRTLLISPHNPQLAGDVVRTGGGRAAEHKVLGI